MILADLAVTVAIALQPAAFDSLRAASDQELFRLERQLHYQLAGPSVRGYPYLERRYRIQFKLTQVRNEMIRREENEADD